MSRSTPSSSRQARTPYLVRKTSVLLAAASAVAIWAVATHALGIEVRSPEMGDTPAADITVLHVVTASLGAALAAWAALAVLERFTARAHRTWVTLTIVVLVVSLGAPLTGEGIGAGDRAVLVLLHVVVAGVVIPGMLHPARSERTSSATASTDGNDEVAP